MKTKINNEESARNRIIQICTDIFLVKGFSKISMDEIAQTLGMSKKTIYKYFSNKDELVKTAILHFRDTTLTRVESVLDDQSLDTYQRFITLLEVTGEQLSKVQQPVLEDLKKYLPDFWVVVEERRRFILKRVYGQVITEGKKEGIIREDTDVDFFLLIYMSLVTSIVNPEVMANLPYSISQVFRNIVNTLFTGILTDEAREKYHSKNQN